MPCNSSTAMTEFEFVRVFQQPDKDARHCRGPVLAVHLSPERVFVLERVFDGSSASDLLWFGFRRDAGGCLVFELCAAHWFYLASYIYAVAVAGYRLDWAHLAEGLIHDLCVSASWDVKEIANMFAWRRARLT